MTTLSERQTPLAADAGRGSTQLAVGAAVLLGAVAAVTLLGLALGSRALPLGEVVAALAGEDVGDASIIVWDQRMPRTLLGLLVGAALGMGGAVAQSLTRNPLADPGLLGVSAGAALAIVLGAFAFGVTTLAPQLLLAIMGAGLAGTMVLLLGTRSVVAVTPQGLALVGVALSAMLVSVASMVVLLDAQTLDEWRFWLVGSLSGRGTSTLRTVAPVIAAGTLLAWIASRTLDALALGDDTAQALGVRLRRARLLAGGAVVVLTGAAVAAAGPLAFVGLAVPHAARALTGPRTAWLLLYSAALGGCLLVLADVVGRIVARPNELPAGVVTALVGAPLALALLRRARTGATT
jgi:iron complex transport system permease protein